MTELFELLKTGSSAIALYGPRTTESFIFFPFSFGGGGRHHEARLLHGLPDLCPPSAVKRSSFKEARPPLKSSSGKWRRGFILRMNVKAVLFRILSGIRLRVPRYTDTAKIKAGMCGRRRHQQRRGNLAAFLEDVKEHSEYMKYYDRIVRHIRRDAAVRRLPLSHRATRSTSA